MSKWIAHELMTVPNIGFSKSLNSFIVDCDVPWYFSLEKLKESIAATEMEQKEKLAKCLNALKDGEKALEERVAQLAKIKNEIQTQTVEHHETSRKITRARAELRDLETSIVKNKEEVEKITEKKESERIHHQRIMEVCLA